MTESEWLTTQDVGAILEHMAITASMPWWPFGGKHTPNEIRDIVGNPFRPVPVTEIVRNPAYMSAAALECGAIQEAVTVPWITRNVRDLAQTLHDGDPNDAVSWRMLHDALADAGCDREDVLRHCLGQQRCGVCVSHAPGFEHVVWPAATCGFDELDRIGAALGLMKCDGWVPAGPHVRGCFVLGLILEKGISNVSVGAI